MLQSLKLIKKIAMFAYQGLPRLCLLCSSSTKNRVDLCDECRLVLPYLPKPFCRLCGLTLPVSTDVVCGRCLKTPPYFHQTVSLFAYAPPIDRLLTQFKYHHRFECGDLLARLLTSALIDHYQEKDWPDLIIPMPLHTKRLLYRGFNQALELAKPISRVLGIPYTVTLCQRSQATLTQSHLNLQQRRANVKKAFVVKNKPPQRVAILDDIVTTGSTVNELAGKLRAAGVGQVDVWCIARTLRSYAKHASFHT